MSDSVRAQPAVSLADEHLPATFRVADTAAVQGQTAARRLTAIELIALVLAAATSVGTWRVGRQGLDVLGGLGAVAFASALVAAGYHAYLRPENKWYSGRAAAESIKTMAWRFAVCGDPFPAADDSGPAAERLLQRIRDIFMRLEGLSPPTVDPNADDITATMLSARQLGFALRRQIYLDQRISEQVAWYSRRATGHGRLARRWTLIGALFSLAGFILGVLKFLGVFDVDLLGIAAAVVSATTAWNQLNQHRMNAASYSVAARELSIIRDRGKVITEPSWALFVSDAEDAISREHTMWLARRGHRAPQT